VPTRLIAVAMPVSALRTADAIEAARLRPLTRAAGLSLGDRACLALAIQRKAAVYTTDAAWKNLDLGIEVQVIR